MNHEKLKKHIHELFDGLEQSQEKRLWKVANKIDPTFIMDDLLNPQDHPELLRHPEFNYEDGQLSGMRAARIAVNFMLRELADADKGEREAENLHRGPSALSVRPSADNSNRLAEKRQRIEKWMQSYESEPWGWTISDCAADVVWKAIETRLQNGVKNPAIVFDLDGTLFDVGHRTLGLLREWVETAGEILGGDLRERLSSIDFEHIGYSLAHAFENGGLDLRDEKTVEIFELAERHWKKRFFDGRSLVEFDIPVEGAAAFAQRCAAKGMKIVYLSGRHSTVMQDGTFEQLQKNGFPVENVEFVLKPDSNMEDLAFKEAAFADIAKRYSVVANFENEYVNIAAMVISDPHACHVIVDTQHSGRPVAPLSHPILRLRSFE